MTQAQINKEYDEIIAGITGTSAQHQATREMMEAERKVALQMADDAE